MAYVYSEVKDFIQNAREKLLHDKMKVSRPNSTVSDSKFSNLNIPVTSIVNSTNVEYLNEKQSSYLFMNLRDHNSARKRLMEQRNREYNEYKLLAEIKLKNRFQDKKSKVLIYDNHIDKVKTHSPVTLPHGEDYLSDKSFAPLSVANHYNPGTDPLENDKLTEIRKSVIEPRKQSATEKINARDSARTPQLFGSNLPASFLPVDDKDRLRHQLKEERNKEYNEFLRQMNTPHRLRNSASNDPPDFTSLNLPSTSKPELRTTADALKTASSIYESRSSSLLENSETRLKLLEQEYDRIKRELPLLANNHQIRSMPSPDPNNFSTPVKNHTEHSIIPFGRLATPNSKRREKENYRKELEEQIRSKTNSSFRHSDLRKEENSFSFFDKLFEKNPKPVEKKNNKNETMNFDHIAKAFDYKTPADDAYFSLAEVDPLDTSRMSVLADSVLKGQKHSSTNSSESPFPNSEIENPRKTNKNSYAVELQRQIEEVRRRKEEEKMKELEYNRQKDEEIAQYHSSYQKPINPGGRRSFPQRTAMELSQTDDKSSFVGISNDKDQTNTYARGGHGIFGHPLTDEQKNKANQYKQELAKQISERKLAAEEAKSRELELEIKERERIELERQRIQTEYEKEQASRRAKQEAIRKDNEVSRLEMEEKRQKSNTTKEKSGVTLSDLKSAERTRPTDNPQTVESARLTPKGYNLISGKSQLEELLKPINYQDHNSDVNSDIIGPPPSFSKLRIASPTNKKGFSEDPALSSSQYTDFIAQLNLLRDQLARERIHVEQALGASLDAEEPEVYDPRLGEFPSKAGGTWGEWSDDDHTIVEMDKAKASRIFDSAVKSKSKSLRALASLSASNINQDANSSRDHPSANLDLIEKERNKFIRREQKTRDLEMQQREYLDAQDTYLAQINDELIKGSGKKSHHPRQNEIFSQIESDSKFVDLDSSMEFEDPRKKIQRDKTRIRPKKLSLSELEIVNSRRLALLGEGKRQESNRDNFDFSTGNETETDTSDPELVLNKFLSYQRDGKIIGSDD